MSSKEQNVLQKKRQESLERTKQSVYSPPATLNEAVTRSSSAISVVRKEKGKELLMWVKARLIQTFTYLGSFERVTEYQIKTLAQRICDKYYYLTPAEIDYFFVAFSNGEYRRLFCTTTVNPQDIMMSLAEYERDVLVARGEADRRKKQEEERKKWEEEAKKPHGWEAWVIYCKKNGFDPETHRIPAYQPRNVEKELYPETNP